jgi:hypothetical protein
MCLFGWLFGDIVECPYKMFVLRASWKAYDFPYEVPDYWVSWRAQGYPYRVPLWRSSCIS